jgi:hypothetical protein
MVDRKVVPFDEFYYQLKLMTYFRNTLYVEKKIFKNFCQKLK